MTLDDFLASVERRAYRMALLATRCDADALDIVQDAMMNLVRNYRHHSSDNWPVLFQRVLQNRILDWHRQSTRRQRLFWWSETANRDDDDITESVADVEHNTPPELLIRADDINTVLAAVEQLPIRQQQAFLLRAWEGFSVADSAEIMACSTGSVKTHYFRAIARLRETLEASHEPN